MASKIPRWKRITADWLCRLMVGSGFAVSGLTLLSFFYYEGTNDSLMRDLAGEANHLIPIRLMFIILFLIAFWLGSVFYAGIARNDDLTVKERFLACGPLFLLMVLVVGGAWIATNEWVLTKVCEDYETTRQFAATACTLAGGFVGSIAFILISILQGFRRISKEASHFSPLVAKKRILHKRSYVTALFGAVMLVACTARLQQKVSNSAPWWSVVLSACGMFGGMFVIVYGLSGASTHEAPDDAAD